MTKIDNKCYTIVTFHRKIKNWVFKTNNITKHSFKRPKLRAEMEFLVEQLILQTKSLGAKVYSDLNEHSVETRIAYNHVIKLQLLGLNLTISVLFCLIMQPYYVQCTNEMMKLKMNECTALFPAGLLQNLEWTMDSMNHECVQTEIRFKSYGAWKYFCPFLL